MSRIEELRLQIAEAAQSTASQGLLEEALRVLNSKVEYVTPAQEQGIGKGIEDIKAGRWITPEELKQRTAALIASHKQPKQVS